MVCQWLLCRRLRVLVEECHEHNDVLYAIVVDLRKAYDPVPRAAHWSVLEQYGVTVAEVRSGDAATQKIDVSNGLAETRLYAPSLLNVSSVQ